jgi:hypothetical protein
MPLEPVIRRLLLSGCPSSVQVLFQVMRTPVVLAKPKSRKDKVRHYNGLFCENYFVLLVI